MSIVKRLGESAGRARRAGARRPAMSMLAIAVAVAVIASIVFLGVSPWAILLLGVFWALYWMVFGWLMPPKSQWPRGRE